MFEVLIVYCFFVMIDCHQRNPEVAAMIMTVYMEKIMIVL